MGLHGGGCDQPGLHHPHAGAVAADGEFVHLAAAVLGDIELAIGGAHAVRRFQHHRHLDLHRRAGLAAGIQRDAEQGVRPDRVHIKLAVQERDAVHAIERRVLDHGLQGAGTGPQPQHLGVGRVGEIDRLVRPHREVVADVGGRGQGDGLFGRAAGKIEGAYPAHRLQQRRGPVHAHDLADPERIGGAVGHHAQQERARRTLHVDEGRGGGLAGAGAIDHGARLRAQIERAVRPGGDAFRIGFRD